MNGPRVTFPIAGSPIPASRVSGLIALAVLVLFLTMGTAALAQSDGGYTLSRSVVGSGGAVAAVGGAYQLSATIGQADAAAVSGGVYTLGGGFWGGSYTEPEHRIYLPLVIR
jgi:hypothetical protein